MKLLNKLKGKSKITAKPANKGKLIVIDGTDGSGKTTQTELLIQTLQDNGYKVALADFPQYGKLSAGPVEQYLNGAYGKDLNPHAASLFYAIDRFDASFQIREWLDNGYIVISNRYVTANAGHQGGKIDDKFERLKFYRWLDDLEYKILGVPKPDLTIILHVPAETAQKLAKQRLKAYVTGDKKHDILEDDLDHLQRAERTYLEVAKLFPNTKLIHCMDKGKIMAPKTIHNKAWELVRRIALKGILPQ